MPKKAATRPPVRRSAKGAARSKPPDAIKVEGEPAVVLIRIGKGNAGIVARVPGTKELQKVCAKWMYILRNRSRWASDDDAKAATTASAADDLRKLGIDESALQRINAAKVKHVEVELLDDADSGVESTEAQQAAAALPWEFLISAGTSELGRSAPLLVTRLLRRDAPLPSAKPSSFLFLESAPGRLQGTYSFESERARLRAATSPETATPASSDRPWRSSESETLKRISARISYHPKSGPFHAIHVSGIDNHQAARVIQGFYQEDDIAPLVKPFPPDGMVVRGTALPEVPVAFDELARNLVPPGMKPWLVSCNLYYSGSRIAPECIRRGAYAALGFQDEVDDEIAELFFQEFYRCWCRDEDPAALATAFGNTWIELKDKQLDLFGTGIVLWQARSAFDRKKPAMRSIEDDAEKPRPKLPNQKQLALTRKMPMSEVLQVELRVPKGINYSLLHNARPFLEKLTLNKLVDHSLEQVSVVVDLNVGDGSPPFRHTELLLDSSQRSLADQVHVPLTAPLLRSLRERVQTTLYAKVCWDNRIAHESTSSVTLLPVDEWFDDTQQNPWLPSFILPRDPAVPQVIAMARRHLVTLLDDSTAGFDGYQSDAETVDLQVQAIWAALVHEYKLLYINPPPAYSKRTQRLRTPSEVVGSNSGTCVDLALLLAACLEYIDIYPVVVLLSGHAFVGYWRNSDDHDEFRRVASIPASATTDVGVLSKDSRVSLVDRYGWRLASQHFAEIRQYLRSDKLRFLEATGLCFNFSFAEALEEGAGNLGSRSDFDSLLDIRLARSASPAVTPLPIIAVSGDFEAPK